MEPITLASTFASIVGLICNFKQEKKDQKSSKSRDFLDWLEYHRYHKLKEQISRSHDLLRAIEELLKQDYKLIIERLNQIDNILASLASHIEGMQGLINVLKPQALLSDQVINILRQLVNSNFKEFGRIETSDGIYLTFLGGDDLEIKEPRFLDDDLNSLTKLGLLLPRIGSRGTNFFGITRNAVKLINAIDEI